MVNYLNKKGHINHFLWDKHCIFDSKYFIKDLSRLGRDASRVVIIDNYQESYKFQPNNGIFVKSWFSDPSDTQIYSLIVILKQIMLRGIQDVRDGLFKFKFIYLKAIEEEVLR